MAVTLTADDILAKLTKDERDKLGAAQLENGQDDPITDAIDGAKGEIDGFIQPYVMPDGLLRDCWLVLSIVRLYPRLAAGVPEKWKDEAERVRKILEDIRDGKFQNFAVDDALVPATGGGAWGSMTKQNFPTPSSPSTDE